ncbi:shikimate dehydrogenase family protein [Ancylobacter lacus]|uniref:shikimate dehydrogenase family protein n=1 Tax=Ancylobacter lacus TaxID=2579970 RepID=UPI001BCDD012|nr:shikimate dehydrogenase [Ancylobacter lacus]MBS7539764.1 shikimate dehydrogenase [Ancylobacter lacus]
MISGATQLLFHMGDPIAQARAPGLMNPRLVARGHDAVLVPMHVAPAALGAALDGLRAGQNARGAVITMPHKIAAAALVDDLTADAKLIGACNVIRRTGEGRLVGAMLDGEGFVAGLAAAGRSVRDAHIVMAGAGGVALGIALALARHGARRLSLFNRSAAGAQALRERIGRAVPGFGITLLPLPDPAGCDIAINATSLGMRPHDPLPLLADRLRPGAVAADVVIRDTPTPFLEAASRRGCATQPGLAMLESQIDLMIDFMLAPTPPA